jgi:hypothetical protein
MGRKKPGWEDKFLGALIASGGVYKSCEIAGITFQCYDDRRRRDDDFARAVDEAQLRHDEFVDGKVLEFGTKGVEKPQWYKGERCDLDEKGKPTQFEVSITALLAYAKSRMSKYRDRVVDVNVGSGGVLVVNQPAEDEKAWREKFEGKDLDEKE